MSGKYHVLERGLAPAGPSLRALIRTIPSSSLHHVCVMQAALQLPPMPSTASCCCCAARARRWWYQWATLLQAVGEWWIMKGSAGRGSERRKAVLLAMDSFVVAAGHAVAFFNHQVCSSAPPPSYRRVLHCHSSKCDCGTASHHHWQYRCAGRYGQQVDWALGQPVSSLTPPTLVV